MTATIVLFPTPKPIGRDRLEVAREILSHLDEIQEASPETIREIGEIATSLRTFADECEAREAAGSPPLWQLCEALSNR